ncbi:hypothetical protein Baya_5006 [Bagarius yarrelli]|uniref:Uncharacterized protein n=1 Tax=Bagarius yarrelli TaxID=175774 RepID=A0A556TV25_BAGYA|nr:hypothetical protein Baya_5006 [Bagarius yarrelli]
MVGETCCTYIPANDDKHREITIALDKMQEVTEQLQRDEHGGTGWGLWALQPVYSHGFIGESTPDLPRATKYYIITSTNHKKEPQVMAGRAARTNKRGAFRPDPTKTDYNPALSDDDISDNDEP